MAAIVSSLHSWLESSHSGYMVRRPSLIPYLWQTWNFCRSFIQKPLSLLIFWYRGLDSLYIKFYACCWYIMWLSFHKLTISESYLSNFQKVSLDWVSSLLPVVHTSTWLDLWCRKQPNRRTFCSSDNNNNNYVFCLWLNSEVMTWGPFLHLTAEL